MTAPAATAPPCTAALRVGGFRAESQAGLHISDHGLHVFGALAAGLESMLDAAEVENDRFRSRLAERFARELSRALSANRRDLGVVVDDAALLSVSGTLYFRRLRDVRFDNSSGLGSEGEKTQVSNVVDAHLILSDASGVVIAETTINLAGPEELRPVTGPKYQTPLAVWRAVEQLVQRRVRFDVPLAFAWSRDVRAGLRAAEHGKWSLAIEHWERATSATNASTRRAAHFDLSVAHELAGHYEEAEAHLIAAQEDPWAPVGFLSSSGGPDLEGQRTVPPTEFQTHLWRLRQRSIVERCPATVTRTSLPRAGC